MNRAVEYKMKTQFIRYLGGHFALLEEISNLLKLKLIDISKKEGGLL